MSTFLYLLWPRLSPLAASCSAIMRSPNVTTGGGDSAHFQSEAASGERSHESDDRNALRPPILTICSQSVVKDQESSLLPRVFNSVCLCVSFRLSDNRSIGASLSH
jgi:hypothetical protein